MRNTGQINASQTEEGEGAFAAKKRKLTELIICRLFGRRPADRVDQDVSRLRA